MLFNLRLHALFDGVQLVRELEGTFSGNHLNMLCLDFQ